jgi:hypothetical protein
MEGSLARWLRRGRPNCEGMLQVARAGLISNVDHAAAMNDRWLFVASLVVFGVFAWFVMRCFVLQHARLIEDHKQARDFYQESERGDV